MRGLTLAIVAVLAAAGCDPVSRGSTNGPELFNATCARCHAQDGKGVPSQVRRLGVPDMTDRKWQAEHSDEDIKRTVHSGSKSKKMPAFGSAFSDEQIMAVIAHVRSLANGPPKPD